MPAELTIIMLDLIGLYAWGVTGFIGARMLRATPGAMVLGIVMGPATLLIAWIDRWVD